MTFRFAFPAKIAALIAVGLAAGGCSVWGTAAGAGAIGATAAQTEKGFRRSMADTEIRIAINDLWLKADEEMFRKVNLQVQEGRVLLTGNRSEEHTSELQSLMRISYAVFCLNTTITLLISLYYFF